MRWSICVCLLVLFILGCDEDGSPPRVTDVKFEVTELGVSCENGFDLESLAVAQAGELWGTNDRGVYRSVDDGRTFHRFYDPKPFELFEPDRATRPFPWQQLYMADGDTWILGTRNDVLPTMPNVVALTEDGGQTYHIGASLAEPLTYKGRAGAQWPLDDGRVLFQFLGHWYLTEDGGTTAVLVKANYKSAGTHVFYYHDPYNPSAGVPMAHYAPDVETARPICPSGPVMEAFLKACDPGAGTGCTNYLPQGCFGPVVGAVRSDGAHAVTLDRRVLWWDGTAWNFQLLPAGDATVQVADMWFVGDDLWVDVLETPRVEAKRHVTYRVVGAVGGAKVLEKIVFRAGDVLYASLVNVTTSGDDVRVLLNTTPTVKNAQNLVCTVGASRAVAPLLTGTPATFEPGRLYLHARRDRWSDMFDRMALQSDGHAYVAAWRRLLGSVPPAEPMWNVQEKFAATATISGVTTHDGLKIYVNAFGERTDLADLHVLEVAPLLGIPYSDDLFRVAPSAGRPSIPMHWVSAFSTIEDELLFGGIAGSWPARAATWTPEGRRPIHGLAVATPAGIALTKSKAGPELKMFEGSLQWVTGIGLISLVEGSLPEGSPCGLELVESDTCLVYKGEATAMGMDWEGFVYVVDGPRGEVHRRKLGGAWEKVAVGLMHPADIVIRQRDSKTLVYVLDGDIWVFEPSSTPAVRTTANGMTAYEVALADPAEKLEPLEMVRPTAECVPGAPCMSAPVWSTTSFPWKHLDGWVVIVDQTVCLPGQDYGESGELFINGKAIQTSTWNTSNVCFDATLVPRDPKRGALWLVRADGTPSHLLPYAIDPPLTPGASPIDIENPLPPEWIGPRIVTSCRSSREEGCEVVVVGSLPEPILATIDGKPAVLRETRMGNLVFEWPSELSPGTYTLNVSGLTREVELVELKKTTLGAVHVDQIGTPEHGQAIAEFAGQTWGVAREGRVFYSNGTTIPDAVTVSLRNLEGGVAPGLPDDQFSLQEDLPRLATADDALVVAVRRATYVRERSSNGGQVINTYNLVQPMTAGFFRMRQINGNLSMETLPDAVIPDASSDGSLEGVLSVDGTLWAALYSVDGTRLFLMRFVNGAWESVASVSLTLQKTVVADGYIYALSRDQVWRVKIAETPVIEGPFGLPAGERVSVGSTDDSLLVITETNTVASVHTLLTSDSEFGAKRDLPTVPGIGIRTTRVSDGAVIPGVSGVVGNGVNIWVAVADRTEAATRGLRLAQFDGDSWRVQGELAGSFQESLCVGPILNSAQKSMMCAISDIMANGCTLFACEHSTGGFVPRIATADRLNVFAGSRGVVMMFDALWGPPSVSGSGDTQIVWGDQR